LLSLLLAVALATVVVRHEGYQLYIVHTGSMMPTLNPGDVVVDQPASSVHPGEIVTFRHSTVTNDLVTHRVAAVRHGVIRTKGDANRTADLWHIQPGMVRGAVSHRIPHLGYALVFLKQPAGVAAVLTSAWTVMLLWGLFFPSRPRVPASA
jgi:signal peptidase